MTGHLLTCYQSALTVTRSLKFAGIWLSESVSVMGGAGGEMMGGIIGGVAESGVVGGVMVVLSVLNRSAQEFVLQGKSFMLYGERAIETYSLDLTVVGPSVAKIFFAVSKERPPM